MLRQHGRKFATAPLGVDRAMVEGVLIDEAIEVLLQLAGDFGGATRTRAIRQSLGALLVKPMHPLSESRVGEV
jgi:hypothetical protein